MRMIKIFLLITFTLTVHMATGQTDFSTCADKNITTGNENQLDSITALLVNKLRPGDFYIIGEAHTFLANNDFQFSLIKTLHKQKLYNVANELPHAACFIFNQYLETGDASLLRMIKPVATYDLLKKIRAFNLTLPIDERIRYYGIDYLNPRHDFSNFYMSLKIIREKVSSENLPLDVFIDRYLEKGEFKQQDVIELHETLFRKLQSDSVLYKQHFGAYYDDLLLMSSNMIGNRTNRDADIFKSFLLLNRQLSAKQKTKPKFISFYGMGHLDNFGNILSVNELSPVKNSVCKIAIQYINCLGGWTTAEYRNDGLYQITKDNLKNFIDYGKQGSWKIGFFTNTDCFNFRSGSKPDAIMIFNSYGNRKMNSWKFD